MSDVLSTFKCDIVTKKIQVKNKWNHFRKKNKQKQNKTKQKT